MVRPASSVTAGVTALLMLAACNSGMNSGPAPAPSTPGTPTPQRGQLLTTPPSLVATFGISDLLGLLGLDPLGQELLTIAYSPICSVNVYELNFETIGAKSEPTTSTGALMVPSGSASGCQGPRPIVEYAHGTSPIKNYDMAQLSGSNASSEGLILAALFAAEGYIVVAPNYAGYDSSTLPYHPYLVGAQQAAEMMDMLTAARSALPLAPAATVTDNHKLFVTGYSQGGYVAMAATSAMQAAGQIVTASAPMSGPYALGAFGDALFLGEVNGSATENVALLANGYQNAYGNLYSEPTDIFSTPYANDIAGLLPSTTPMSTIYSEGLLPSNALFSSTPPASQYASITPATTPSDLAIVFAMGFASSDYLILNSYRLSYLQDEQANPDGGFPATTTGLPAALPQNPLRQDLKTNDLRNWTPTMPTLLCGGDEDPEVFFFNTQLMQAYWSNAPSAPVTILDIAAAPTANDPYADEKNAFQAAVTAVEVAAIDGGATDGGHAAVLGDYHAHLVPPFCLAAVKSFFDGQGG
ncbi:MAG: alpha/beta hydrolase family protein [Steroidobacteraceae bacterium]